MRDWYQGCSYYNVMGTLDQRRRNRFCNVKIRKDLVLNE